jgi:rhodanese-related sulfurtransferase
MRSLRAAGYWRQRGVEAWSMSGGIHLWSVEIDPAVPVY